MGSAFFPPTFTQIPNLQGQIQIYLLQATLLDETYSKPLTVKCQGNAKVKTYENKLQIFVWFF